MSVKGNFQRSGWIFPRSLGVICYARRVLTDGHKNTLRIIGCNLQIRSTVGSVMYDRHIAGPKMMMMVINCFCDMVDRRKEFSLTSSRGHCQRSSPLRISDRPQARFEPAHNLSSGLVEWSCVVEINTAPRRHSMVPWRTQALIIHSSENFRSRIQKHKNTIFLENGEKP